MARNLGTLLAAACALCVPGSLAAIEFRFDYTYDATGFFDSPEPRAALEAVAEVFDVLLDDLTAISPSGSNRWMASFFNPASGANETIENMLVPANTLTVFVGGRNLIGDTLGVGGPGGFSGTGISQAWFDTLYSRGEGGEDAVRGIFADEFGPWGGAISFDTHLSNGEPRTWHFDIATDPARNTADFYSVALHEIGHVLGFGTADSFGNLVRSGEFDGLQAKSLNNGQRIRMHSDDSHWAADTRSPPWDDEAPVTAMDPTIITFNGVMRRRHFTPLDFAALDDLGWTVDPSAYVTAPEPLPGDYNNNGLVEQADLDLVLGNWGKSATAVPSTWTNDLPIGTVDQAELDGVLTNWGAQIAAAATALASTAGVPEPATWLLGLTVAVSGAVLAATRSARSAARTAHGDA
jgi:hypothetical protein